MTKLKVSAIVIAGMVISLFAAGLLGRAAGLVFAVFTVIVASNYWYD